MSQSAQDDLYERMARFACKTFDELVEDAIKRALTYREAEILHAASDLKLDADDLAGM